MPLRLSFVLYMVVTALAATAVCALIINGLDNTRIELYYKYRDQAEQIPIPEGGHAEYGYTNDAEVYVIYDADDHAVDSGSVPYDEGSLVSDVGGVIIMPEYSAEDKSIDYVCRLLQALTIPVSYLVPRRHNSLRRHLLPAQAQAAHRDTQRRVGEDRGKRPGLHGGGPLRQRAGAAVRVL